MEKTVVVSDEQFNELSESTNSYLFTAPVCDPPSDDVLVSVPTEIHVTSTDVHVLDAMVIPEITIPVQIQ